MAASFSPTSTKPYLVRAWHEWCSDNGFTPYLLVKVDHTVSVPREFVQDGEIVLNIGLDATGSMSLGNDAITFKARFSGRVRDIVVPLARVQAIYAKENGQGMGFEVEEGTAESGDHASVAQAHAPTIALVPHEKAGPIPAREHLNVLPKSGEASTPVPAEGVERKGGNPLRIVK